MWTLVSDGEQAATSFPSGDQQTDVAGPCSPSNLEIRFSSSTQQSTPTHLTTQEEEGLETTLAGSTVQRRTPEEQPTAS